MTARMAEARGRSNGKLRAAGRTLLNRDRVMPSSTAESLYAEHAPYLRRFAHRLAPGHADDIVQEVFCRAIKHLRRGNRIDHPKSFLCTAARNIITLRWHQRKKLPTDDVVDIDEYTADHRYSPELRARDQQQLDALCAVIAQLPARQQEAFVRRRIWGQNCREIAAEMGVSHGVARNYVMFAWRRIQETLVQGGQAK